jgi:hypothetical protein
MNIKYVLNFSKKISMSILKNVWKDFFIGGTCEARKGDIGKT